MTESEGIQPTKEQERRHAAAMTLILQNLGWEIGTYCMQSTHPPVARKGSPGAGVVCSSEGVCDG
jgi:hypothetical protein